MRAMLAHMQSPSDERRPSAIGRWLERAPSWAFTLYAMVAAFSAYFCMYGFRKPFAAAKFEGLAFAGTEIDFKTALVISQILGYTISKYVGIKLCSEVKPDGRARFLVLLILIAEAALGLFAIAPSAFRVVALFINGLALGMIWGLVVSFLEGRKTSELLLAALSCSFIVASGAVKDVARFLMRSFDIGETTMPFWTGLIFLPPFLISVWCLAQLPKPTPDDARERTERKPMNAGERWAFASRFFIGLAPLMLAYFFLTAFRDFRDNYGVEIFKTLGYGEDPTIFTRTEIPVAFGVMIALALLNLIKDNRLGLLGSYGIMIGGFFVMGLGTLAFDLGTVSGEIWMILIGLGSYLAYVPYNSVLFDRMIASTRTVGTAVFAIYVADAIGYTGSIGVQLFKDLFVPGESRLSFIREYSYFMALVGGLLLVASGAYFVWVTKPKTQAPAVQPETY